MEPTCTIPFLGLKKLLGSNKISKKDLQMLELKNWLNSFN